MLVKAKSRPLSSLERRRTLWRRLRLVVLFLIPVGFAAGVIYLIFFSAFFRVKDFQFNGVSESSQSDVIAFLEKRLASYKTNAIFSHDRIFFWKNMDIKEPKDAFPEIADIKVEHSLFSRVVKIEVTGRERFGVWCEGSCFWIDKEGIAFSTAPETEGSLVRFFKINNGEVIKLGDQVLGGDELNNFLKSVQLLQDLGISVTGFSIEDIKLKEMAAATVSGPKIYFSFLVDPYFAKETIKNLKSGSDWGKLSYINLTVPGGRIYEK